MERHIVVSLWAEACLYGWWQGQGMSLPAPRWNDDSWAWFIAHVVPWAAERKFANTAILDKEAERRYWAGPWEQTYPWFTLDRPKEWLAFQATYDAVHGHSHWCEDYQRPTGEEVRRANPVAFRVIRDGSPAPRPTKGRG